MHLASLSRELLNVYDFVSHLLRYTVRVINSRLCQWVWIGYPVVRVLFV